MADSPVDEDLLEEIKLINKFKRYRGEEDQWDKSDFKKKYRQENYQNPNQPVVAVPPFTRWSRHLGWAPSTPKPGQEGENFLEQTNPDITTDPAEGVHWKGIKYLGGGGGGHVGLWEYTGPEDTAPKFRRVAVKEIKEDKPQDDSLLQESIRLERLRTGAQSSHIITLQVPRVTKLGPEELGQPRYEYVRRLVFEYCDMGDLQGLIHRRNNSEKPLEEASVWQIFNCLVDGLSVLEFGAEHRFKPNSTTAEVMPIKDWELFIHFDLKPQNILLNDERFTHSITPLCKLADFGLTKTKKDFDEDDKIDGDLRSFWRSNTTKGYYAPEQFTGQWEYADWKDLGIAGNYGPATNVWGMGLIMSQLMTLDPFPLSVKKPYRPVFSNEKVAKGIAFGVELRSYPYSQTLRDLITECLYEDPAYRPTAAELKERVRDGFNAAILANGEVEPWADFLPAPPPPPPPASTPSPPAPPTPAPALAANANNIVNAGDAQDAPVPAGKIQCQFILANGNRCRNIFNAKGGSVYCHLKKHRKR